MEMNPVIDQVKHYNEFAVQFRQAIISSDHPDTWTSDPDPNSPMNVEMRERSAIQEQLILKYFTKAYSVLDMGCGYGRQTFMMARKGYQVTGMDNSDVFIDIAREIFRKHQYPGEFICDSIFTYRPIQTFRQLALFDVIEHFRSADRHAFFQNLSEHFCAPGAVLIVSFPYMNQRSPKDLLTNLNKFFISHFQSLAARKEHPYPIPYFSTFQKIYEPWFDLIEYQHNAHTAFFVLQKRT